MKKYTFHTVLKRNQQLSHHRLIWSDQSALKHWYMKWFPAYHQRTHMVCLLNVHEEQATYILTVHSIGHSWKVHLFIFGVKKRFCNNSVDLS